MGMDPGERPGDLGGPAGPGVSDTQHGVSVGAGTAERSADDGIPDIGPDHSGDRSPGIAEHLPLLPQAAPMTGRSRTTYGHNRGDGMYGDPATIRKVLTELGDTWAVVGLSNNRDRAAYGVAEVLQRYGKRVVPVHPRAETVHGEQGYASLSDIPFPVDVVDVFVNSDLAGPVADEAARIGAKAVWFQLGVLDEEAYRRTREAGLDMIMDRCPAIEIPRLPANT